jgi:G3E family GTPase
MFAHAHIITGSFGAGKTTAIRHLMARKRAEELWVVILNEFTDAGLDALAVAESAQGRYDVRLVSGGCLCCAGELEFGKQIRDILRTLKPERLLIEPSGAAHAREIVDELSRYEAQGVMSLDSVVCLVDALDAVRIELSRDDAEWSQIQASDVLLLTKPDLADAAAHAAFQQIAAEQFPSKQWTGLCLQGEVPDAALERYTRAPAFSRLPGTSPPSAQSQAEILVGGLACVETQASYLGYSAVSWVLPAGLMFSRVVIEPRLEWLLEAQASVLQRVKGVLRTGPGPSWSFQSHGRGLGSGDSDYRRDSRVELVLRTAPSPELLDAWRALLRDAALPPSAAM